MKSTHTAGIFLNPPKCNDAVSKKNLAKDMTRTVATDRNFREMQKLQEEEKPVRFKQMIWTLISLHCISFPRIYDADRAVGKKNYPWKLFKSRGCRTFKYFKNTRIWISVRKINWEFTSRQMFAVIMNDSGCSGSNDIGGKMKQLKE